MRVVDSGVVVAAFASWHEAHEAALAEMVARPQITAHAMVEVLSVLTRLPAPHRAPLAIVTSYLQRAFPASPLALTGDQTARLIVDRLPALSISGGAVYDALIAETTRLADGLLITLDQRALATYDKVGCRAQLLSH